MTCRWRNSQASSSLKSLPKMGRFRMPRPVLPLTRKYPSVAPREPSDLRGRPRARKASGTGSSVRTARSLARDHIYVKGQPGDLFLSKLNSMVFDISDFDETGNVPLAGSRRPPERSAGRRTGHQEVLRRVPGPARCLPGTHQGHRRRAGPPLVCLRPAQPPDVHLLPADASSSSTAATAVPPEQAATEPRRKDRDLYYEKFLKVLFFEGFAKPEEQA